MAAKKPFLAESRKSRHSRTARVGTTESDGAQKARMAEAPVSEPAGVQYVFAIGSPDEGEPAKLVNLDELPASERRVQISAARLRATLDKRLDRETPPEVEALAEEPL